MIVPGMHSALGRGKTAVKNEHPSADCSQHCGRLGGHMALVENKTVWG
jgi:hypothetical protein